MPLRRGFTMIELLVVVSVIAVLAGILIPTISMVRQMANDVKCGNNLQQVGAAIVVFKHDNDDMFPGCLMDSNPSSKRDLVHSGGPLAGVTKIFLCPYDLKQGTVGTMGRASTWDNLSSISDRGSSYCYEAGDQNVNDSWLSATGSNPSFYSAMPASMQRQGTPTSWAQYKHDQKNFGNMITAGVYGAPFPGTGMPIIRCYWHHRWTGTGNPEKTLKKVKNVAWDLNVFNTSPYWEHDANSLIPLPSN